MSTRITKQDLANATDGYRRAVVAAGLRTQEQADTIRIAAPYGQVLYLIERIDGNISHTLPGFTGSTGSGFLTSREAYDSIWLAARTLDDMRHQLAKKETVAA